MTPTADEPRVRCFIAIPIADPARTAAVAYLERLRATVEGVAWTQPENLHLTLKFLGDVPVGRVASLTDRLRAVGVVTAPFTLQIVGVGAFPNLARPRALWIGVAAPALLALADAVDAACVAERFAPEQRGFRPHVTLGRVRTSRRMRAPDLAFLAADGNRELGLSPVERIVLFRSELRSGGARHTALATVPLTGAS